MKNLEEIISPIAAEMQQFEVFFARALKADTEPMDAIMRYVLDTRGKRLRPMLVLLSAKMFGEVNEQTLRAATFVEMVHSATLIHDDVVDDDNLRRGRASIKARWDSRSAVLAGDYLLAKALLLIANDTDIMNEMLRTTIAMSEGELMQNAVGLSHCGVVGLSHCGSRDNVNQPMRLPWYDSPTNQYLDIITRKTAMLMRSCCVAGAMSVNALPEQIRQIADFGLLFGQLFQLRDDLLDDENAELAQALLPEYLDNSLKTLEGFPPTEIREVLKDLTLFCAERRQ